MLIEKSAPHRASFAVCLSKQVPNPQPSATQFNPTPFTKVYMCAVSWLRARRLT
jgi:hypothetical protein